MTGALHKGTPAARFYVRMRRTGRLLRRSRRARVAAWGASILVVAFAVGAWVVVPLAVSTAVDEWAAAAPGRSAAVRRVAVSPFTLTVTLHGAELESPGASAAADRVAIDFGLAALLGRVVALDGLVIENPRVRLSSNAAIGEAAILRGVPIVIGRAAIDGGRIEWVDETRDPLVLDGVSITAFDVVSASAAAGSQPPARFDIDVREAAGGVLRLEGEAAPGARSARGRLSFENVDLAPIASRIAASPAIAATSSGAADFEWRRDDGTLRLTGVSFRALDADIEWPNGERLSAASLEAAGGADIGGGAWRLSGEVNLHRPVLRDSSGGAWLAAERLGALDAVAALRRSGTDAARSLRLASPAWIGTLSLTGLRAAIVLDGASGAPDNRPLDAALALLGGTRPNAAATAVVDDPRDLAPRVAAGRLELEAGALEIVDASLGDVRPSFDVLDVVGALERTGTEPAAVVADLAGRVGEEGAARVRFRAELGEPGSRDVDIELGAVPARLFTEHARRLAGYLLEDGTIDAAIDYRVDADGSVEGEARVGGRGLVIEHTEEAADDPSVALALALLEDQHGVAETTYRFRSPNDGRERIDRIVAASIVTQLETVAAAPFAALGTAAGVDASALDTVSFRPGEAEPAEPETLAALADALLARPAVGLRVQGVADRVLDRDALAAQQIELHVTLATAGPTQVARPRPVDFASPRHRDVLDEFAGERLSAEERETIASYFSRTPDGRIVEGERSAYYRALFEALVENETIPENGIERLGRYRARAIANALAAHGVPEQRIEILPAVVQAGASDSAIEVPLAVFALSTRPAPDLAAR